MADGVTPEFKAALLKGSIAEAAIFVAGGALWYTTGETYWLIGAAVLGTAVMLGLIAQAGGFKRDRR
ncbi:MAG: hypothetical protein AB7Q23_07665 [Hyphomonadaceae bacterium]